MSSCQSYVRQQPLTFLQRHGNFLLPNIKGEKQSVNASKAIQSAFHMDIDEVQAPEGKPYPFVGTYRTSNFAVTQLVDKADRRTASEFLQYPLNAVPYRICTILADHGIQFVKQPLNHNTAWLSQMRFAMICVRTASSTGSTKPDHPWTNGQVERMNRTMTEATVKRFHYKSHDQLRMHSADVMGLSLRPPAQEAQWPHAL